MRRWKIPRILKDALKHNKQAYESKPENKCECQIRLGILGNLEILNHKEIGRVGFGNVLNWQLRSEIYTFSWNFWRAKSFCEIWIEKKKFVCQQSPQEIYQSLSQFWMEKQLMKIFSYRMFNQDLFPSWTWLLIYTI